MNKVNEMAVGDLWLSSFLVACGLTPTLHLQSGRVVFCFPASPDLNQLIVNYQSGCTVKALDYASAAKTLRGQMLSFKKSGGVNV